MLGAEPVMEARDPSLQIGEDQVDDRQEFLCDLWVSAFGNRAVVESALAKAGIAAPVVGDDQRSGSDGVFDESAERVGPSSNPGFIDFDMFLRLAANLVALGAPHPGAELMKDAEGRLVARQAELPLKLDGRHSGRLWRSSKPPRTRSTTVCDCAP